MVFVQLFLPTFNVSVVERKFITFACKITGDAPAHNAHTCNAKFRLIHVINNCVYQLKGDFFMSSSSAFSGLSRLLNWLSSKATGIKWLLCCILGGWWLHLHATSKKNVIFKPSASNGSVFLSAEQAMMTGWSLSSFCLCIECLQPGHIRSTSVSAFFIFSMLAGMKIVAIQKWPLCFFPPILCRL